MAERGTSAFGGLLRQLRARARLTQEELAEAASLSTRTVSDLERGINRTAHKETADLLAGALGLAGQERASFIAAARGRPTTVGAATVAWLTGLPSAGVVQIEGGEGMPRTTALVGRDSELAVLAGLMMEVAAGRGGAVLIEGEPGIGKSALVRAALAEAGAGCQVFWGAGDELGQALPLLPLLEGLRVREPSITPRRDTIVRLLRGETAAGHGMDVPTVLAEQLLALITEECAVRPAILVVDDLQWADQASVTLWARLAGLVQRLPLLLVGIMRPVPQRDDLLALRRAVGENARLQLAGLTRPSVAELVATLAGGKPDDELLRLAGGAAGSPLYLIELIGALKRSSRVTITAGTAALTNGSAPGSLSAAIADRLGLCRVRCGRCCGRRRCWGWILRCRIWRLWRGAVWWIWFRRWRRRGLRGCWRSLVVGSGSGIR
jgi:DNA-binding XRE family transcriptional regulator